MAELKLYLFGEPRFEWQGSPITVHRRKSWALMAVLALAEQRQNREVVAALLWPELDQAHARAALRSTLSALITQIPGEWLDSDRAMLTLSDHALWVDVQAYLSLLNRSRAHKHVSPSLCAECLAYLLEAVDLYRADFMAGFSISESAEYDDWQVTQREWLSREQSYALKRLASYYGEIDDFETALVYANHWLALDSLQEGAHRLLMRLYAANGQRTEALRQYQRCAELLELELATPPEDETTRLYMDIHAEINVGVHANLPSSKPAVNVLPVLPSLLVGREQALRDIKHRLGIGSEAHPVTIIQGWPGVGKSTTVAALAHDHDIAAHFSDGVLWASLGKTPSLRTELTAWTQALGLGNGDKQTTIETLTAQLTAALKDRHMLLIVDDIWEIEHIAPFRVSGQFCAMIITSRLNDVAQALAPTALDVYRLPVLTEADALELLAHLAPETVAQYPAESRVLVHDLEGLPLAIQVAGRLLHSEARLGWGVGDLLRELRDGASLLQAHAPSDIVLGQETSPTIAALLKRSTDALDADMQGRFALLGLFVPKPATFALDAMAAAWDVTDPRGMARLLVNRGLLEPVSGGKFQMHALLVLHARSLLAELVPS